MIRRSLKISQIAFLFIILFPGGEAFGREEPVLPRAPAVFGSLYSSFQANSPLIRPDGRRTKVHPFYQYLEVTAASPREGLTFNGYLRGREVFSGGEKSFDAYHATLQFDDGSGSIHARLGRQVLTEGTNYYLLDGGLLRFRPVGKIELVAYGGYQDQSSQPDPEDLFQDSALFGVKLKLLDFLDSVMSVGYERIDPVDLSAKDLLNLSFSRVVPFTRSADFYGRGEIDIDEKGLSLLTTGVGISPSRFLHLNLEYDSYQPHEDRNDFLQDRIFDLFTVSRLHQAKGGVTYIVNSFLEASASYSFSRYEVLGGATANGHIARAGLSWDFWRQIGLRGFQGVYVLEGRGKDRAVGINLGISEELLRGLDLRYSFAYVHARTVTGQDGDAFSHALGIQYLLLRNLLAKTELELNANPDFRTDTRVNLGLTYYFYF